MSSSYHSTGDAPAQRVPAWKRLGLKLKPASEAQSYDATHHPTSATTAAAVVATPASSSVPNSRAHLGGSTPNAKRRASSGGAPALDHSAKRARQDNWQDQTSSHQTPKKPKAVSFTADTAGPQPPVPVKTKQQQKQQTSTTKGAVTAAPAKPIKRSAPVNLEPALAYLRTWHTARESWKFNKNHQTKLLEQVFAGADETTIPAADINVFYEYIRGLQGGVRTRLRELASGIRTQDMEEGASGFAAGGGAGKTEMAERKQKEYEEVIRAFLGQPRTAEKRRFEEVEYVLRTTDMEMQRRVVKRMRAETVLDELSETDASETTTTSTTTSGESTATEKGNSTANPPGRDTNDDDNKRLKLNDGPQQRTKRKRKLRTAAVEDDTSSESESEGESEAESSSSGSSSSGSSSSGSSSDEDEDEDEGARATGANEDTSSSSSSSSSSESESDSEDDDED
ncbi:hypothetical protein F5Y12DRAFT_782498 [Xylaria sp. FL1777]|nr:hypothetical protein F5Y12DRAFT_782498 [Xylaria sp. FL1777]